MSTKIIVNYRYRKTQYHPLSNLDKKSINLNSALKYYNREEACEYNISTQEALNYYNNRHGSTGGFNQYGDLYNDDALKKMEKYKPKYLYTSVISFDKDFAIKNNINSRNGMQKLMKKSLPVMYKNLGFENDNIEWGCYFHTNTEHPHVHVWMYEKEEKHRGKINKNLIRKGKSTILSALNLNINLYAHQDSLKNKIIEEVHNIRISDKLIGKEEINKEDKEIIDKFLTLDSIINDDVKTYNYNSNTMKKYHEYIDELAELIEKKESVLQSLDEYKNITNLICKKQEDYYGKSKSENIYFDNKVKKVNDQIKNSILKELKKYRQQKNKIDNREIIKNALLDEFLIEQVIKEENDLSSAIKENKQIIIDNREIIKPLAVMKMDKKECLIAKDTNGELIEYDLDDVGGKIKKLDKKFENKNFNVLNYIEKNKINNIKKESNIKKYKAFRKKIRKNLLSNTLELIEDLEENNEIINKTTEKYFEELNNNI